jgi:hypothetical protein
MRYGGSGPAASPAVLGALVIIVVGKSVAAWLLVTLLGHSRRTALTISALQQGKQDRVDHDRQDSRCQHQIAAFIAQQAERDGDRGREADPGGVLQSRGHRRLWPGRQPDRPEAD